MCSRAPIKDLWPLADQAWRKKIGQQWFGYTYQDVLPLPSAWKNIGLMISHELAYQIAFGATKAASQIYFPQPTTPVETIPCHTYSWSVTPK
jgi:hypothetical protein